MDNIYNYDYNKINNYNKQVEEKSMMNVTHTIHTVIEEFNNGELFRRTTTDETFITNKPEDNDSQKSKGDPNNLLNKARGTYVVEEW